MTTRVGIGILVTVMAMSVGCSSSSKSAPTQPETPAAIAKESGGFYAEETYKGRVYVFGTEKAHQAFRQTEQVPHIAKTYIGAGPDGQSVVLEADTKTSELQERLKSEYEGRHHTKLP